MGDLDSGALEGVSYEMAAGPNGVSVLRLSGELDLASAEPLRTTLAPAIQAVGHTLVIDVEDLRFADSSAIALWVSWRAEVAEVEIRHPSPLIRRIIDTMGLGDVLRVK